MTARALGSIHWPGMQSDISRKRAACNSRDKGASSQSAAPPTPLSHPSHPLELICPDYPTPHDRKSPIIFNRHSAWLSVHGVGEEEGAQGLISTLNTNHTTLNIRAEITSDRGPECRASTTKGTLRENVAMKHTTSLIKTHLTTISINMMIASVGGPEYTAPATKA